VRLHRICIICAAFAVSACASIKPTVGPVTGSVTIGGGTKTEFVPVAKTIKETCNPPPALLVKHAPLPLIAQKRLTPSQLVNLAIDDAGAYNELNADDAALQSFITKNCQ